MTHAAVVLFAQHEAAHICMNTTPGYQRYVGLDMPDGREAHITIHRESSGACWATLRIRHAPGGAVVVAFAADRMKRAAFQCLRPGFAQGEACFVNDVITGEEL